MNPVALDVPVDFEIVTCFFRGGWGWEVGGRFAQFLLRRR